MAAEEVKGMERMLGGRKRQKREVKETRVDRWLSLPPEITIIGMMVSSNVEYQGLSIDTP